MSRNKIQDIETQGTVGHVLKQGASGLEWAAESGGGGGGGGEANTASNLGTGQGLAATKAGVDLPFKSILAATSKIVVAGLTNEVTIDVDESAVDHDALLNFVANEHIDWTNASDNFLTTGSLKVNNGTLDLIDVQDQIVTSLEGVLVRAGVILPDLPTTPPTSAESAGIYAKVSPAAGDDRFMIYGEVASTQPDGSGGFMKIVSDGLGDAVYIASRGTGGIPLEAAAFDVASRGIISTLQYDPKLGVLGSAAAAAFANTVQFGAVSGWDGTGGSTVKSNFGSFWADRSLGHSFGVRIQNKAEAGVPGSPTDAGVVDGTPEFRIIEWLGRQRWAALNNGEVIQASAEADASTTLQNSPVQRLRGAYWTGAASADLEGLRQLVVFSSTFATQDFTTLGNLVARMISDAGGRGVRLTAQNNLEVLGTTYADTIEENTGAAGVTVDGVLLKDGAIAASAVPDGADATAIHVDVAAETAAIPLKGGFVADDRLFIEDSADGYNKKVLTKAFLEASLDHDALSGFVANEHIDWTQPGAGTIDPSNYSGGGGGVTVADACVYNTSEQNFNAATTLILNANHVLDAGYSLASNQLTITNAGRYEVTYGATFEGTTSSRSQGDTWLENNTAEVAGTRRTYYLRTTNYGASATCSIVLDLSASDVLRIRGQRTNGTANMRQEANGTTLTVRRIF